MAAALVARVGHAAAVFASAPAKFRTLPGLAAAATVQPKVDADAKTVTIVFVDKHEHEHACAAKVGQSLLEVAHIHSVDLEGACEASLACSTCHVILSDEIFEELEEASEEEEDMLDLAFGLSETSRLGCQVFVEEGMEGMRVRLPDATRNFYVDGHVPQPH